MGGFGQAISKSGLAMPAYPGYAQKVNEGFLGGGSPAKQTGFAQNQDPQVQDLFSKFGQNPGIYDYSNKPLYGDITNALSRNLQPFDQNQAMQFFEEGVANPALRYYEQVLQPQITSQNYSPGVRHTGALNRAIASSAENLSQGLGSLRANYLNQAQQNYQTNQLNSLAQSLGLLQNQSQNQMQYYNQLFGTRNVTPIVQGPESNMGSDLLASIIKTVGPEVIKYLLKS